MAKNINLNTYFYLKGEINTFLNNKADKNFGSNNARKNVVTDANGNITTEEKPHIPENVSELNNDSGFANVSDLNDIAFSGLTSDIYDSDIGYSQEYLNTVIFEELDVVEHKSNKVKSLSSASSNATYPSAKCVYDAIQAIPIPTKTSDLTNDSGFLTSHQNISGKEDESNKVTSISSASTNTQYPSAKCVYDYIENLIGGIEEDMLL